MRLAWQWPSPHLTEVETEAQRGAWMFSLHSASVYWHKSMCPFNKGTLGTSLAVQWLRLCLPMQGVWVWSLVRELGSHTQWGVANKFKKTNKQPNIKTKTLPHEWAFLLSGNSASSAHKSSANEISTMINLWPLRGDLHKPFKAEFPEGQGQDLVLTLPRSLLGLPGELGVFLLGGTAPNPTQSILSS